MQPAKPTKQQLLWHDMELGVLIHYCMEIKGDWYITSAVREALDPKTIHPKKLEPGQWVRRSRARSSSVFAASISATLSSSRSFTALWSRRE